MLLATCFHWIPNYTVSLYCSVAVANGIRCKNSIQFGCEWIIIIIIYVDGRGDIVVHAEHRTHNSVSFDNQNNNGNNKQLKYLQHTPIHAIVFHTFGIYGNWIVVCVQYISLGNCWKRQTVESLYWAFSRIQLTIPGWRFLDSVSLEDRKYQIPNWTPSMTTAKTKFLRIFWLILRIFTYRSNMQHVDLGAIQRGLFVWFSMVDCTLRS